MNRRLVLHFVAPLVLMLMIGCGGGERNQTDAAAADVAAVTELQSPNSSVRDTGAIIGRPGSAGGRTTTSGTNASSGTADAVVLFVGTSLTAGQGLAESESFPLLVQARIDSAGLPFRVINAGVSGETSAGALRRVDWLLQQRFDVLVLETGANDMLRGVDPSATERNIQEIVDRVRERWPESRIVLTGMMALPNLGADYGERFSAIYPRLAQQNDLVLVPFLLQDVAAERNLNLADGVHPNAAGHRIIAETVWSHLEPVLREIRTAA